MIQRLTEAHSGPAPRIGALFAGAGGLDLAVQAVLGGSLAWVSEIDPAASKVLAHHYPDVPNHGDITAVDWSVVEPVDVLTGGFPCQDLSLAGGRKGLRDGTRSGLWSHMAAAIDALQPRLVVIENVRGLLSATADGGLEPESPCLGDEPDVPALRALGAVLGDLAELGLDAEWVGLRAADVGACHGRFRVGVLAWPATGDAPLLGWDAVRAARPVGDRQSARPTGGSGGDSTAGRCGGAAANPDSDTVRLEPVALAGRGSASVAGLPGDQRGVAPHAQGDGRDEGRTEPARLVGGPDAAERRPAALADPDGVRPLRSWPARRWGGGLEDHRPASAADPDGLGLGPDERQLRERQPDAAGRAAGDAQGLREQDESLSGTAAGLEVEPVAGAVHRDRERGPAEGVRELGRAAPELAWGPYAAAVHRWGLILGRPAPAPTEPSRAGGQRLSPRFVEFMQGFEDGWVTGVPGISRNDQLRILGNAVVQQQFTEAIRFLLDRAFELEAAA